MKLAYRPEIDGLRSIAVLSVIIYHSTFTILEKSFLSGGFLGVDIFFVISGYLITSIILKEIYKNKNFSFKNFYERRLRRIIPPLLFVMLCSFPFAYIILFPEPFKDFSKSVLSSIFFISNIYFNFTTNRYGDEETLLKPFLHTWSLSVEEQFYILFPIFLILITRFFYKYLFIFLIIGFFTSISFSQYLSFLNPNFNFYMLLSRGFELLLGSILSYSELNNSNQSIKLSKKFYKIFPKLGFLFIVSSLLFFNNKNLLPSFYTLIPLTGVYLIIRFSHKDEMITKFLSNKILVFFGIISYSLYLFHYPIFAFSRIFEIFYSYYKILIIFLTILISIFSFYYIEKPFRNKKIISFKKLIIFILGSLLLLIFLNSYVIKKNGIKTRIPKIFQQNLLETNIVYNQKLNTQKVILIGDSHAEVLEYYLNEELKKNDLSLFRHVTYLYLKDFYNVDHKTKIIDKSFFENNNKIENFLKENSNLIIVMHQRWALRISENFFDNEEGYKEHAKKEDMVYDYFEPIHIRTASKKERQIYIREGLILQINNIINQGHKLILVYPVPEMGFQPYKLLYSQYVKKKLFNRIQDFPPILSGSYEVYKKRNKIVFEILDSVQHQNIYRVYPHTHFCNKQLKNRCVSNDKENIFYRDDDHLSLYGSKFIVMDILKIIKDIK